MLLLASGRGERLGAAIPKAYVAVRGEALVVRSLRRLSQVCDEREIILAVNPEHREPFVEPLLPALREHGLDQVVDGGATRQASMTNAFEASDPQSEIVLVHDAARPFFPVAAVRDAIARASEIGGALLAIPVSDTLKSVDGSTVTGTVDRSRMWAAQTPQLARRADLATAIERAHEDGFVATDDVSLLEHAGIPVEVVTGSPRNLKVTTPADLAVAEHFAAEED